MKTKTYICNKKIFAVPAKMVNGSIWPEGLPLPVIPEPEKVQESCPQKCCSVGLEKLHIQEGYLYTESPEDTYPKWMSKAEFERDCYEPCEAACCADEDEPCGCGCEEGATFGPVENMTFGEALEAVKHGARIAREGWNGKGMYVFLAKDPEFRTEADISEFEEYGAEVSDLLVLRTAQGTLQPGWLATQSDMLAEDWKIVE